MWEKVVEMLQAAVAALKAIIEYVTKSAPQVPSQPAEPKPPVKPPVMQPGTGPVSPSPVKPKKIMIEVGHGPYRVRAGSSEVGFEEGANGPGTTEYKENLYRASVIHGLLTRLGHSVKIQDAQASLGELGASGAGHDLFVSLHLNAFNHSAQGCETLIHSNGNSRDLALAQAIQSACVKKLKIHDRGVKRQGLGVLSTVPDSVHACCLSEAFFIDAVKTFAKCREMSHMSAEAIAEGIHSYSQTF